MPLAQLKRPIKKVAPDTDRTKELLAVLEAFKSGDFTARMAEDGHGRQRKIANTLNDIIGMNQRVVRELDQMKKSVGEEGKITQRASSQNLKGAWGKYIDSINSLIDDLVQPTAEVTRVIGAVARGDLSQRMDMKIDGRYLKGGYLRAATTINTMVDQLGSFAEEVTRVAREVGTEGKLGGQAVVKGVSGTWKDLTDNVNQMAANLTSQVRNIAEVTTAVAKGDLSKKITVNVRGEILALKNTINTMVDQLGSFAGEVTRVAREVGTEGKLGGQAVVKGVSGTWKGLTDNVNAMASNLTSQVRNIAEVTTAVAKGDLSKKITVNVRGEILELKNTINVMVDQLGSFAGEVTRVAREVGTEGKLGGQAVVKGVSGTWKGLTDNVNAMAANLTSQVRNIAEVTTAVAGGNLSKKITVDVKGEILALKNTINTMVDQLGSFADEVTRVARDVGTEGKLGGQATVKGVSGTWKDLTDNVNQMAANLTSQVRNIAEVTTAVAKGDLSKKITVDVKGEILALKNTINVMVDQLGSFAGEVTRVAREVGTEGKLGGQAVVKGVSGTWKGLTDNVNAMAGNLTSQVRNIAEVTTAVAKGDLSKKITVDVQGEILALKNTINVMVDQLGSFAGEVTRVAREVGTEGKLGGQATVKGVSGTWKDLTDNVNQMAANLTSQVRNIAEVTTAVARGNLSKKITVDVKGEILALKNTINTMVDQLGSFADEVTRVARDVGTEGKLGGQATVKGVSGTWKGLTDNVNQMAANLTSQVRNIAEVTTAVAKGDLSKKITVDVKGEILALKNTINVMVDQLGSFAEEVTRVAREVGTEGKLGGQATVKGVSGTWKGLTDNVNQMAANLTSQVRNIADVTTAVAKGDLSKKITVNVKGEILELKNTINTMVDQLGSFAGEVTRVARDVGTEGKLGGQATVKGVSGTWKDLTDNVNQMAANLTDQVRDIAKVVTAVANGNLKQKLTLHVKGEIATLADTINEMIDTLAIFADQVTTVAREVGVEGKLGGQSRVPGAAGIWKDLTENVNQLAANLTTQVRAIGEVATAVTTGDLTRSIAVQARGEVEKLKNNINEMIRNLRETTQKNKEQDWLKTNLAKFTGMLQGQRDLLTVSRLILSELAPLVSAHSGVFYIYETVNDTAQLRLLSSYAYSDKDGTFPLHFKIGEGLIGQCAETKRRIMLTDVPSDYLKITSGLGAVRPSNVVILPILFEGQVKAVLELSSLNTFGEIHLGLLEQVAEGIGVMINTIGATMQTEDLLKQSQALTEGLQRQQEELKKTNEYKSEFLAKMSHELRTPLNSLLVLAKLLSENMERNLTDKQIEFAKTMHSSGTDLLHLINDILDLSKIESGKTEIELGELTYNDLRDYVERTFRQIAIQKGLEFSIEREEGFPLSIQTDVQRLQQILKNLLSNAFKFTEQGKVTLRMEVMKKDKDLDDSALQNGKAVIAFSVVDTGIGIPEDKHAIIFEPFQQAEGGTSRKYGGTGLGLSISHEIAKLLGGDISLISAPSKGSTFTLYLPQDYPAGAPTEQISVSNGSKSWASKERKMGPKEKAMVLTPIVKDDRHAIKAGDEVVLIIEDNPQFASVLLDIARKNDFKGIVALQGEEAFHLARRYKPAAVTLDVLLPDIDGWSILDRFKHDPVFRHIPVTIISGSPEARRGFQLGAVGYLKKPVEKERLVKAFVTMKKFVERKSKNLLIVEGDNAVSLDIKNLIGEKDVRSVSVNTPQAALIALESEAFDCLVLEADLPNQGGFEILRALDKKQGGEPLPVVLQRKRALTPAEDKQLKRFSDTMVIKEAASPESLLQETTLFLHCAEDTLPESTRRLIQQSQWMDTKLANKQVLIVDDDFRNIYAISTVLERHRIKVLFAENGKDSIQMLKNTANIDIVLMDIMMPEMDGYQTMKAIRATEGINKRPIIARTAKAMKGDRQKCIDAGASDYIAKPVDTDHLLSLLRVWLCH